MMYLGAAIFSRRFYEAVLVHNPIGFGSLRSFAHIKHKRLLNSYFSTFGGDNLIGTGGLPVPGPGYPIGSRPIRVFAVPWAEKVPLFFTKNRFACKLINSFIQLEPHESNYKYIRNKN